MNVPDTGVYLAMKEPGNRIARLATVVRTALPAVCFFVGMLAPSVGFAQEKTSEPAAEQLSGLLARVKVDQGGGFHFARHFAVVFGGIKQGSGAAAGPAVSWDLDGAAYAQLKAVYSIHQFKLLQARYESRPLFRRRSFVSARLRWMDAPKLPLYEAGPDSPNEHAEYGMRSAELSASVKTAISAATTVVIGSGVERYASDSGWIDTNEDEALSALPEVVGLTTRPWFVHSFAVVANDTRMSPGFSRSGRLLSTALHDYHDAHGGRLSFRRVEIAAQQLLPSAGGRGALSLKAHAWLSQTTAGHEVPFFLMPTLGGGDYLRAYKNYRFRDRHAALLSAEYRWAVHEMVDIAGIYEAGTVSSTIRGLSARDLAQCAGGGIRVHTKTSDLVRVDLARGRDGFKLSFGVTTGS